MRVVITESLMKTSVGNNTNECFDAFVQGKHGFSVIENLNTSRFKLQHSYEMKDKAFNNQALRATSLIHKTLQELLLSVQIPTTCKLAVVIGTGLKETRSIELWSEGKATLSPNKINLNRLESANLPVHVHHVYHISNACSSSLFALGFGEDLIRTGEFDLVIVVGCDVLVETMHGYLDRGHPQSPDRLKPFNKNRIGTMLGEGSAAVVMESEAHALKRGAAIKAFLRGVGMSCDAYHETAPALDGIKEAIQNAHERARIQPSEVQYIQAHGTGTILNDKTEIEALKQVFGDNITNIPISGIKSMTGHTSGASGLIGVITAIESMNRSVVPPTLFLDEIMDEASDLFIPREALHSNEGFKIVQVDAFGFGGVNAVAILERCSQDASKQ